MIDDGSQPIIDPQNDADLRAALNATRVRNDTVQAELDALEAVAVTADTTFGTDEVLLQSDGTGRKAQATSIATADVVQSASNIGLDQIVIGIGVGKGVAGGGTTLGSVNLALSLLQSTSLYNASESWSAAGLVVVTDSSGDLATTESAIAADDLVTADTAFGTTGRIIVADGTGKAVEASSVVVSDLATEADLTSLEGRVTTAEGEIDTLQIDLDAAELDIDNIEADYVSAAATFDTDNRLIRSDGTGRGVQYSTATITDTGTMDLRADSASAQTMIQLRDSSNGVAGGVRVLSDGSASFLAGSGRNFHIQSGAGPVQVTCAPSEVVINEPGADLDFRIEGDTATNLFFVNAGLESVQIGTTSPGTLAGFYPTTIVMNDGGGDVDFRVEGDTATNLFVCDAGNDRVDFGTTTQGAIARFASTFIVINNGGLDIDFIVSGDTMTYMFFTHANPANECIVMLSETVPNFQGMDRGIFIGNATTAPTGDPTGGFFMFIDPADGALKVRGPSGTVTTLGLP